MGRLKKLLLEKSRFKLRGRKLKDGATSLFIDHYNNGKHSYEFLKLYLLPDTSESNRRENKRVIRKAYDELNHRIHLDFYNRCSSLSRKEKEETLLEDFVDGLAAEYKKRGMSGHRHFTTVSGSLRRFRAGAKMKEIDRSFCREYSNWLRFKCESIKKRPLSPMTAHVYFRKLRVILEHAVRLGFMERNPWDLLERWEKIPEPERMQRFLTPEELKRLEKTDFRYPLVKNAFLFACFSGLRISDVLKLQWHEINHRNHRFFINIVMKKTLKRLEAPLSLKALEFLPVRKGNSNRVFEGLPCESGIQKHLKRFCLEAGIRGRIHFHISRHTFATMLLTSGVDIYTAGKLMGHSDIRSTQVYAKVVDESKFKAIGLIDRIM